MTAGNGSKESSAPARWSDLCDDLVGMVHFRLSSLRDRVGFAAVCKTWRAAIPTARPAAPLLLLSTRCRGETKHLCGPNEDSCCVLRVPSKVSRKLLAGSHDGGWVAAFNNRELVVVNLFSGVEVVLSAKQSLFPSPYWLTPGGCPMENTIPKLIFSQAPTSDGCILAVITEDWLNVALCKVGSHRGWARATQEPGWRKRFFIDIAFCNGELYGLTLAHGFDPAPDEELIKFTIGWEEDGSPVVTATHVLAIQRRDGPTRRDEPLQYASHIFELQGKPSMAVRTRWLPNREAFFKVFELVDADSGDYKWEEVTNFGDYALFLGLIWSKAVHVPLGIQRRGLERNHIYYSCPTLSRKKELPGDQIYSLTSGSGVRMYCREDPSIGDGVKRTGYYTMGSNYCSMWLSPPDLY